MWILKQAILSMALAFAMQSVAITPLCAALPNVVLIVSDDQGYHDLGCFGSEEVLTPNLDRLATSGVRLTNFYVSWPACTPSRGSLLTGRYPQRHGVYDMIRNEAPDYGYRYPPEEYAVSFERIGGMDTREVLLPAVLKRAGYCSAIFGKWDLGVHRRFLPLARGFDEFYGFVNTGIDYFTHERYGVPSMYRDNDPTTEDKGTYCTALFLREAKRFLAQQDQHQQSPFFLYLPFNAPHNASNLDPIIRSAAQGTEQYKAMYPQLQAAAGVQPGKRYGQNATVRNRASRRLEYVASITQMDTAIGEILDILKKKGLQENTFVFFMSDNGGGGAADNHPLRGRKAQLLEGGIRVPAIASFPGRIPAGVINDRFCSTLDLFPTITQLCGVSPPEDIQLDGHSLVGLLQGESQEVRSEMFWKRRGDRAARVGNWKWLDSASGSGLFNLSVDIGESHDLSDAEPQKLEELKAAYAAWEADMQAAEPRGPFRDF